MRPNQVQELHYLPIELGSQVFAIPMSEVSAIQPVSVADSEDTPPNGDADTATAGAKIIDLGHLFYGETPATRPQRRYVVLITTSAGTCGVAVDRVRSARRAQAADQYALPHLITAKGSLFSGLVRELDGLVLVIDSHSLVEHLQQVAPELVMEHDYVPQHPIG